MEKIKQIFINKNSLHYLALIIFFFIFSSTTTKVSKKSNLLATVPDSLDIKIGQMILIGINDRKELNDNDDLLDEISSGKVGGIILFEKNISKTESKNKLIGLISLLKRNAKIPLIISIDEEGGKVHRLKEKYGFVQMPSAAYLGQLNNPDSTYFYNNRLAAQLANLGINLNFAPTLDMAINPDNTVIVKTSRSFSSDEMIISNHAMACINAHHDNGIKTILKHFPGHGSSSSDSHLGIVDVSNTWSQRELLPYSNIVRAGNCDAIMTAHIINKNWDSTMLPATLSNKVIEGMIRKILGFDGVVFSDDMQMNAISKNYGFENAIALAINAGVDILMFGNNVHPNEKPVKGSELHSTIKKLVKEGKISETRINESFLRIIKFKSNFH